jgi:hypothetical protein
MFAAYGKCSRPTFVPEEKCLRPMDKKNGAKKGKSEKLERKQLNNYNFQRNK